MAGYSDNPLVKKLGIKPGNTMYVVSPPDDYLKWISPLPDQVTIQKRYKADLDFIHVFAVRKNVFETEFLRAKDHLNKQGMLWISWPRKSSGVATEIDEKVVRDYGLKNGLVDVKVCAVSEIWSGLKFVFRLKDR